MYTEDVDTRIKPKRAGITANTDTQQIARRDPYWRVGVRAQILSVAFRALKLDTPSLTSEHLEPNIYVWHTSCRFEQRKSCHEVVHEHNPVLRTQPQISVCAVNWVLPSCYHLKAERRGQQSTGTVVNISHMLGIQVRLWSASDEGALVWVRAKHATQIQDCCL